MAQEQIAATIQPLVDGVQDLAARSIIEIDQDVSTESHVDAAHDCRAPLVHQVEMAEVTHRPDAWMHLPAFFGVDEVILVLRNHRPEASRAVSRTACLAQDAARDVVSEHANVPSLEKTAGIDEHRDGEDLFATRAARAPNVESFRPPRKRPRPHRRKNLIGEGSKLVGLAEELRFIGRQNLCCSLELFFRFRVELQVAVVLGEIRNTQIAKTLTEATFDDIRGVVGEVDPAELIDEIAQQAELLQMKGGSCVVQQRHLSSPAEGQSRSRA